MQRFSLRWKPRTFSTLKLRAPHTSVPRLGRNLAMKKDKHSTMRPETVAIHAGLEPPPPHGAVSVPIYQSSTFSFASADEGAEDHVHSV